MKARGFTLVMVPTYHQRSVREQVVEALPLADIAKTPIAASWAVVRSFPADNAAAGLPPTEKIVSNYVSALWVEAVRGANRTDLARDYLPARCR